MKTKTMEIKQETIFHKRLTEVRFAARRRNAESSIGCRTRRAMKSREKELFDLTRIVLKDDDDGDDDELFEEDLLLLLVVVELNF